MSVKTPRCWEVSVFRTSVLTSAVALDLCFCLLYKLVHNMSCSCCSSSGRAWRVSRGGGATRSERRGRPHRPPRVAPV